VTEPILRRPFADLAEDMDLDFDEKEMKVLLRAKTGLKKPPPHSRIVVALNQDGLPEKISWYRKETDPEDPEEGEIEVETSASFEWTKLDGKWFVTMMNSNHTGERLIAKYEYAKVKGVWLPKKVERIDPLSGVDKIPIENLKVNEGIEDSEFSRW